MKTLVTIEAVHNGKVLDWTWRRCTLHHSSRAADEQKIGQYVVSLMDDIRQRGWSCDSRAGIRFQIEFTNQTN
jgi:hypothetical protein